ncbi:MAG: Metallo-hydrolase/oxidoreductase [Monoraphidium minutum]|nr:MAG: Metallo-hydrolase/oxidoreductase [Monoraphidium minutum]
MSPEQKRAPRPENVEGDFFVDKGCIDCMTCRWVAPDSFSAVGLQAAVTRQPATPEERLAAMQALYSCPVHSIHVRHRDPSEVRTAQASLPRAWPTEAPGVYAAGWHSEASFGGAGWLLTRPGRGNVLVDAPRFTPQLAARLEELGGVEYIFLTHKDDVADHAKWAAHFGAARVIHAGEANAHQGTDACEVQLSGPGPSWPFPDGDDDLTIIHTPGHTEHHLVLFSARHKALFSGDHLSGVEGDNSHWRPDDGRLYIFTEANWYSVPEQLESVKALLDYDWLHVLPGHGMPARVPDAAARLAAVSDLLARHAGAAAPARAAW